MYNWFNAHSNCYYIKFNFHWDWVSRTFFTCQFKKRLVLLDMTCYLQFLCDSFSSCWNVGLDWIELECTENFVKLHCAQVHWRLQNKSMLWIFVHGTAVFFQVSLQAMTAAVAVDEKCTNKLQIILQYQTEKKKTRSHLSQHSMQIGIANTFTYTPAPCFDWTSLWEEKREKKFQLELKMGTCKKWSAFSEKKTTEYKTQVGIHCMHNTHVVVLCANTVCISPRLWINKC